jgi:hypothetical protein
MNRKPCHRIKRGTVPVAGSSPAKFILNFCV